MTMSDRFTAVHPREGFSRTKNGILIEGFANYGRENRGEMVQEFRKYYARRFEVAQAALALTDDQIIVETYLGSIAQNKRQEVTE